MTDTQNQHTGAGANGDDGDRGEDAAGPSIADTEKIIALLRGTPSETSCERKYISETKGYGLVATRDLTRGESIVSEPAMVVGDTFDTMELPSEYNYMLAEELKVMGSDFVHEFFKLPALSREVYGRIGAHFERCSIPCPSAVMSKGNYIRALGITSAWVNHGCLPNAQHTLIPLTCEDENETAYTICIRAITRISKGEEITVPYELLYMVAELRFQHIAYKYGFECVCNDCLYPDEIVEGNLSFLHTQLPHICEVEYYNRWPVNAMKAAHLIIMAAFDADLLDTRYPRVLEQVARICAHHSDYGRALAFIETAEAFCFIVEGFQSPCLERLFLYEQDPENIPGSGQTTIGYSTKDEISKISQLDRAGLQLACMYDQTEYVRLCYLDDRFEKKGPVTDKDEYSDTPASSDSCTIKGDGDNADDERDEVQPTNKGKQKAARSKKEKKERLDELMMELQLEKTAHDKKRLNSKKKRNAANKKAQRKKAKEKAEFETAEPEDEQEVDLGNTDGVAESSKAPTKLMAAEFLKPTSLSWADMDSDEDGLWETVPSKKEKRNKKRAKQGER